MAPKTVGIFLENTYEDLELWYTWLRLKESGHIPILIATEKGKTYTSRYNRPCVADICIDDIKERDLDALVIPGGWAPDIMRQDDRFVQMAKDFLLSGKPVAAVCRGPLLFCTAKCLKDRTLTGLPAIKADIENAGAIYLDQELVVDKNLMTSRVPKDMHMLAKALVDKLDER